MLCRALWGQHPLNVALLHPPWTMGAAQQRGQEPDAGSFYLFLGLTGKDSV